MHLLLDSTLHIFEGSDSSLMVITFCNEIEMNCVKKMQKCVKKNLYCFACQIWGCDLYSNKYDT